MRKKRVEQECGTISNSLIDMKLKLKEEKRERMNKKKDLKKKS